MKGRWTTYRLKISSHKNEKTTFDIFHRALADYNVHVVADNPNQPIKHIIGDGKEAEIWTTLDLPAMDPKSPAMAYFQLDTIHLPFPMRYQLEVCLSHGFINEHNISRDFLVKLVSMHETLAVRLLEKAAEAGSSGHRYYDPLEIFKLRLPHKPRKAADGHLTYMRAAKVTPSMIYYLTPVMETSNRIIRQFWGHEDRFLRVKFEDETTKIFAKDDDTQEEIFKRIMRTMKSGIRIGERHYEFLAFGNSQFRENGAYFFAGTESLKAQEIRDWMGNLRDIRVIAKWAARLGQQFSTTRTIYGAKLKVKGEQDIVRNGYTFTDGVGKLSPFLAQWIAKDFPGFGNMDGDYPSLFQFRMGGCKGVVAVDPNLQAHEMVIRKSQYKFAASHEGLDICRLSAFATSKLNRQIISLLSTLGVEDGIFMGMLQRELSDLREAMVDDKAALEQLQKRIDFNEMTLALAAMVIDGFMKVKEPFMMSVLHLWRAWSIKYIKQKAQITIDQGAFLLGCVDETSKLQGHFDANQPGLYATTVERVQNLPEIFFQVRDPPTTGPYEPKTGVCMIARNPSLHPGDLRIVKAVDVPELHHLKDVLVLPQTGDRDLANMCSGGDLDGDDYMVIWDYDLLPPPDQWNQEAMDFRPPKPKEMIREVTVEDITEFFITYMKNNRLPQIAHAHLAWSDSSDMGVHDMRCIELAQLHSCAVDYAKSGVPAVMERRHRPRLWPHFMEKAKDRTYHSKKILGQMYDHVSLVDFKPFYENAFDERILKAYKLDDERYSSLLQQAAEIKPSYDGDVRRIMAKHGIETEFEVWSTFVLQHNYQNGEYKFHEEMGSLSGNLKGQYRKACIDKAGGADFSKIGPFVAAMYKVTSDETAAAVAECRQTKIVGGREVPLRRMRPKSMPLMSFPWLFYAELGKIASGQHGAASVVTLQGTHKKPRPTKKFDGAFGTIPDIETKEGVVHPGEELKLFGDAKQSLCADPEDDGIKHSALDPEHVAMVESGITGASGAAQVPKRRRALPFAKPLKDWGRKEAVEDLIHRPDHDEDDLDGWESSEESNSARLNNIEISEEELDMMADRVMPHTGLVHPTHSDNDSFKTASMRSRGGTNSSDAQTEGDLPVEHCADASVEFIFKKYPNVAHANFVNYERNISSCIDSLPDDGSLPGSRGVEHTSYEVEDEGGEEVQIVIGEEPSALEALGGMLD